jgi:predicted acetyltransferase
MLRTALPIARELGIDSALVTCDPDNVASRKVIEACGGVFEDARGGKLRFWVSTTSE